MSNEKVDAPIVKKDWGMVMIALVVGIAVGLAIGFSLTLPQPQTDTGPAMVMSHRPAPAAEPTPPALRSPEEGGIAEEPPATEAYTAVQKGEVWVVYHSTQAGKSPVCSTSDQGMAEAIATLMAGDKVEPATPGEWLAIGDDVVAQAYGDTVWAAKPGQDLDPWILAKCENDYSSTIVAMLAHAAEPAPPQQS